MMINNTIIINRILILVMSVFLFTCCMNKSSKIESNNKSKTDSIVISSANHEVSFKSFIDKFSSDSTFQKNHIKFPLKTVINGYNFEESDSIYYQTEQTWKYVNLNKRKVYVNAIDCKIDSLSNSVTLLGIDTGVKLIYHFRKVDNTWFLVQIEDSSN